MRKLFIELLKTVIYQISHIQLFFFTGSVSAFGREQLPL